MTRIRAVALTAKAKAYLSTRQLSRPIVVVRSARSTCLVCEGEPMYAHLVGVPDWLDAISPTDCMHCGPAALPVLMLPAYRDRKRA